MKLSTGKVAFAIEFDNGDTQHIYFNPSDPQLAVRLVEAKDRITEKMNELEFEDFELDSNGAPAISSLDDINGLTDEQMQTVTDRAKTMAKAVSDINKIIRDELDRAFDSPVSEVAFKYCSPLATVQGNYYVIYFLEAITPEIQEFVARANKETERKMKKHIGKYAK